ncbi:MAG: hypothetical protein ABIJ97_06055 [Bacteroidota bacterium]
MSEINYTTIITYKIKDIVSLIIINKKMSFIDTLEYLYKSSLYENLSNEKKKLWHLSSLKLFHILENEKKTNILQLPDFV